MSNKRIYVLNGHPAETSLSRSIAETYAKTAQIAGHDVRITHIRELDFDPDYGFAGYAQHKPLEPALQQVQADIEWAQHVVMVTPMWWGGLPAKLKGLLDRTLLPGWAFDTRNTKLGMPLPMLKGRSARGIVTSDTPGIFFRIMYRNALLRQIKGQIFKFVGMSPAKITHFAPAGKANGAKVTGWLEQVKTLAERGV